MKRIAVIGALLAAVGVAVAAPIVGTLARRDVPATPAPSATARAAAVVAPQAGDTPMAARVATIGILNKRNGLSRDLRMKPGDAVRIGDLVVRLRACETTADWEEDKLTGAFVQVVVKNTLGDRWRQVFSGWLFRETPSLNVVEHPVYDVWAKDCTMRHAEVGPDTVTLTGDAPSVPGKRSSARKSPADAGPSEPEIAPETAASSNPI